MCHRAGGRPAAAVLGPLKEFRTKRRKRPRASKGLENSSGRKQAAGGTPARKRLRAGVIVELLPLRVAQAARTLFARLVK